MDNPNDAGWLPKAGVPNKDYVSTIFGFNTKHPYFADFNEPSTEGKSRQVDVCGCGCVPGGVSVCVCFVRVRVFHVRVSECGCACMSLFLCVSVCVSVLISMCVCAGADQGGSQRGCGRDDG